MKDEGGSVRETRSNLHPWRLFALTALVGVLALIGGVGWVSHQEQDNRFCASCHTQPETEYLERYARAEKQPADDLASFHHRKDAVRCIDCHVGEGFVGRSAVVAFAGWNAFKHYAGIATQPAKIVIPIQNEGCSKCHQDALVEPGFENHVHNKYFDSNESPPFIRCTDCHVSHRRGDERTAFQFRDAILPQCEYCHVEMGRGPRGLAK
jgi:nitrate/TMAO reductase-like tetraheme cytochrome c subunit